MPTRRKLYTQFLRQLLPLMALAFVLAAAVTAGLYYQDQRVTAEAQRKQTLETFAHVLVKPLWDCNSLTADGIIQAITLQPNVQWASALWIFERTFGKPLRQLRQAMHKHEELEPPSRLDR